MNLCLYFIKTKFQDCNFHGQLWLERESEEYLLCHIKHYVMEFDEILS